MATRDLSGVFLMHERHQDFAAGTGPYPAPPIAWRVAFLEGTAKIALALGVAAMLIAAGMYFYQGHQREALLASVRTVTATVTGCEGPGRYQNIRFHYTVNGEPFNESAYQRRSIFVGGSGLTDACAAGTVKLNYRSDDPIRWAIAPLSPITRDDLPGGVPVFYIACGPLLLFIAGVFSLSAWAVRKELARKESFRKDGVILEGQLLKMKEDDGETFDFECEYTFVNPNGLGIQGRCGGIRRGLKKKDFPAPGTRLLILYVNDELHEAL